MCDSYAPSTSRHPYALPRLRTVFHCSHFFCNPVLSFLISSFSSSSTSVTLMFTFCLVPSSPALRRLTSNLLSAPVLPWKSTAESRQRSARPTGRQRHRRRPDHRRKDPSPARQPPAAGRRPSAPRPPRPPACQKPAAGCSTTSAAPASSATPSLPFSAADTTGAIWEGR